jgi:hypothetical protein
LKRDLGHTPAGSTSFRTAPVPRGHPKNRDRPAGEWADSTDYLPDRPSYPALPNPKLISLNNKPERGELPVAEVPKPPVDSPA